MHLAVCLRFNYSLWKKLPLPPGDFQGWGWGNVVDSNNVLLDGSFLKLRLTKPSGQSPRVGQIMSVNSNYEFGYFEISAKVLDPGNYKNGQPCANGLHPGFWLFFTDPDVYPCYHDEIDILEKLYETCSDVNKSSCGIWDVVPEALDTGVTQCTGTNHNCFFFYQNASPLFLSEHKFAVEWFPSKLNWYIDDALIFSYNGVGIPQHALYVVLNMAINIGYFDSNMTLPQDYKINYFRYYQLNKDCNNDANLTNGTLFGSFVFALKRNITIGNGSSTISMASGQKKTFRATNDITIYGDFTAPLGSELNLIPTACF